MGGMSAWPAIGFLALFAACATPREPAAQPQSTEAPAVLRIESLPVDTHTPFPSGWHVMVVEPVEVQGGTGRYFSAESRCLSSGELLSRWPILGAIVDTRR